MPSEWEKDPRYGGREPWWRTVVLVVVIVVIAAVIAYVMTR